MVTPNQAVAKMVNDTVATIRCARDRYSEKLPESHERMNEAPSKATNRINHQLLWDGPRDGST